MDRYKNGMNDKNFWLGKANRNQNDTYAKLRNDISLFVTEQWKAKSDTIEQYRDEMKRFNDAKIVRKINIPGLKVDSMRPECITVVAEYIRADKKERKNRVAFSTRLANIIERRQPGVHLENDDARL